MGEKCPPTRKAGPGGAGGGEGAQPLSPGGEGCPQGACLVTDSKYVRASHGEKQKKPKCSVKIAPDPEKGPGQRVDMRICLRQPHLFQLCPISTNLAFIVHVLYLKS